MMKGEVVAPSRRGNVELVVSVREPFVLVKSGNYAVAGGPGQM